MEQRRSIRLVTAYRESADYCEEYVGWLMNGFFRHHPSDVEPRLRPQFKVVEDERWPGWWCKMAAIEWISKQDQGWYLADLDTIITGELPNPQEHDFVTNHDFYALQPRIQSGFMFIEPAIAAHIFEHFIADPEKVMQLCRRDGDFIAKLMDGAALWRDVTPGQVVSWKVHCTHERPADARVVCYHGKPRPRETGWADSGSFKHYRLPNPDRYLSA